MFLETLDLKTNDILIYSQNQFDFNESFKVIYKNRKIKRPIPISYFDVCNYVKDPSPKNLIIYRMLTNVDHLDAYSSKYGYFIKINNKVELIYFDPIFAVKDLKHLRFDLDPNYFRFKIQQVGLTSLTKKENQASFAEVYSFDLKAVEAQNQNDKIFADAIFAFDPDYSEEVNEEDKEEKEFDRALHRRMNYPLKEEPDSDSITNLNNISEDKEKVNDNLSTPAVKDSEKVQLVREEIIALLKQALNIDGKKQFTNHLSAKSNEIFHARKSTTENLPRANEAKDVLDLFKSTLKTDNLSAREKLEVILKLSKS